MIKDCVVLHVFVASPDDCEEECRALRQAILEWNARYTKHTRRIVLPLRWNEDAVPSGGSPQDVVDEQLLEASDFIVAVFKQQRGPSRGTEHEIRHFLKRGLEKRVMIFFHRDAARDVDLEELHRELKDVVFYGRYDSPRNLADQVQNALYDRAEQSLAAEPIELLRNALDRKLAEWRALDRHGTNAIEQAHTILDLMGSALQSYESRRVGVAFVLFDRQIADCRTAITKLVRDQGSFVSAAPWDEADKVAGSVSQLLDDLPSEDIPL